MKPQALIRPLFRRAELREALIIPAEANFQSTEAMEAMEHYPRGSVLQSNRVHEDESEWVCWSVAVLLALAWPDANIPALACYL